MFPPTLRCLYHDYTSLEGFGDTPTWQTCYVVPPPNDAIVSCSFWFPEPLKKKCQERDS